MADSIGDLVARVLLDSSGWDNAIANLRTELDDFQNQASKPLGFQQALEQSGPAILGVGTALSGISAAFGLVGVEAVKVSEGLNTAKIGFTTMLGSGEAAEKMLKDIQQFAATTPFEFPDLVNTAQRMKALGFEASQVIPTLRTVGDTASAMGKGKESIDLMVLALGQMTSKGKVSAQEMNQLAEQGVGAWKILADSIGVSIPEAMKLAEKGAISASQAVPALLAGMNTQFAGSMDKMSQTLTGQWSNFKDQITMALVPIGQSLVPVLQMLLPILASALAKVAEFAKWFGELPDPIRNAGLALGAMAAAAGPLLLAVGGLVTAGGALSAALAPLGLTIGGVIAAMSPWVIAIGLVVAALVALGTWVYTNWDPIVATLTQAWTGLTEAWNTAWGGISTYLTGIWTAIATAASTVWTPVVTFFTTIWNAVAPYFTSAWNSIAGALSGIWNSIKEVAASVWGAITGVFATFLEWAAKIPGAQKLLNLDDAWKSAQKASEELNKTAKATESVGKAAETAAPKIVLAAGNTEAAAKKAAKAAAKHAEAQVEGWEAMQKRYADQQKEFEKTLTWFEGAYKKIGQLDQQLVKSEQDLATDYARAHEAMRKEATKTVETIIPLQQRIPPEVQKAIKANADMEQAYKDLGITSATELDKQYQAAKTAYDLIMTSGTTAATDIDKAWVAMESARVAAVTAHGGTVTAAQAKTLADMKAALDTSKTEQTGKWNELGTEVSTIVTNFTQDMAKSLFEGDMSWGEKAKGMLKSLGEAGTSMFIQPFTDSISTFMSGALKSLLGGEGLGGVMKSLTDIGSTAKGLFGGGAKAATTVATDVAGTATDVAGTAAKTTTDVASQAASTAFSSVFGMVTGGIQAVMSIVNAFQMAKQENTLNAIEHNTRYTMMYVGERADGGILGRLFDIKEDTRWLGDIFSAQLRTFDFEGVYLPFLADISTHGAQAVALAEKLVHSVEDLATSRAMPTRIEVTATGVTTKEAATQLGNQIAANLTNQLVGGIIG